MSDQPHLDDATREHYERQLAQHYGQPVRPVSEVCNGIYAWLDVLADQHTGRGIENGRSHALTSIGTAWKENKSMVLTSAAKSNLLFRLLYLGEDVRTQACPVHAGEWSGYTGTPESTCRCQSGANFTGWLPNT